VKFDILEDGSVANVKIVRSSGVSDLDKRLVSSVNRLKYKARPGCGIVESTMVITIDVW